MVVKPTLAEPPLREWAARIISWTLAELRSPLRVNNHLQGFAVIRELLQ